MARKVIDCREYPSVSGCSLRMEGEEEELLAAAVDHAASVHGESRSAELREQLKSFMKTA